MTDPTPEAERGTSYDEVPYSSYPYPRTHPDHLHTIAGLFGLKAPSVTTCRVLELGCASGGNLLPMAEALPEATFVGIDLSGAQIDSAMRAVEATGLDNVQFRKADILDIGEADGTFDYVLCHGVYSWVPPTVQRKILQICRERLAPNGVGFISYNTYPGWYLRQSVRDMMRYHVRQFEEPTRRVEQARALVDFLANAVVDDRDPYSLLLRRELDVLSRTPEDYLFHEHLEEFNAPCYFHEFAARLHDAQLQYLGDAYPHTMLQRELPTEVAETIGRIAPDIIALEQYSDFIRNRQFRQTLVCRAEASLSRNLGADLVLDRHVAFAGKPTDDTFDLTQGNPVTFKTGGEVELRSSRSATKAALLGLSRRWPASCDADTWWSDAEQILKEGSILVADQDRARRDVAADLLESYFRGGLELRSFAPRFATEVSATPCVGAYARYQASHDPSFVTNRRHERVSIDAATAQILVLCDGTRDVDAIVDVLRNKVAEGVLTLSKDDVAVQGEEVTALLRRVVDETLQRLVSHAVLDVPRSSP